MLDTFTSGEEGIEILFEWLRDSQAHNRLMMLFFWPFGAILWLFISLVLLINPEKLPPVNDYDDLGFFQKLWNKLLSVEAQFAVPYLIA